MHRSAFFYLVSSENLLLVLTLLFDLIVGAEDYVLKGLLQIEIEISWSSIGFVSAWLASPGQGEGRGRCSNRRSALGAATYSRVIFRLEKGSFALGVNGFREFPVRISSLEGWSDFVSYLVCLGFLPQKPHDALAFEGAPYLRAVDYWVAEIACWEIESQLTAYWPATLVSGSHRLEEGEVYLLHLDH